MSVASRLVNFFWYIVVMNRVLTLINVYFVEEHMREKSLGTKHSLESADMINK